MEGGPVLYWRLALESGWRALSLGPDGKGRDWESIRVELEERFHLNQARQQKRGLVRSAFLGFYEDVWIGITNRKRDIFGLDASAGAGKRRLHLAADQMLGERERIVVARFPMHLVSRIYTLRGGISIATAPADVLRFDGAETEEQRLDRLLQHGQPTWDHGRKRREKCWGLPPPGYRCHNCNSTEHFRQNCDKPRRLAPTGIPRTFLQASTAESGDGSGGGTNGEYTLEDGTTVKARIVHADILDSLKNCY